MSDINEKKSQKDQIILNKSVIEQHLKTQFTEGSTPSPKLKLQTILTNNNEKKICKFIFDENDVSPEIKHNGIQGYLKTKTLETTCSHINS